MIALLITLVMGLAATLLFLLAQHKDELWNEINEKQTRKNRR